MFEFCVRNSKCNSNDVLIDCIMPTDNFTITFLGNKIKEVELEKFLKSFKNSDRAFLCIPIDNHGCYCEIETIGRRMNFRMFYGEYKCQFGKELDEREWVDFQQFLLLVQEKLQDWKLPR